MTVKIEDISENLHGLIKIIGMENFLKVSKALGGSSIYTHLQKCTNGREKSTNHKGIQRKKHQRTEQKIQFNKTTNRKVGKGKIEFTNKIN